MDTGLLAPRPDEILWVAGLVMPAMHQRAVPLLDAVAGPFGEASSVVNHQMVAGAITGAGAWTGAHVPTISNVEEGRFAGPARQKVSRPYSAASRGTSTGFLVDSSTFAFATVMMLAMRGAISDPP